MYIPDSVRELCGRCFQACKSLRRVTFGPSSSLERIGPYCFRGTEIEEVCIPDSVRELRGRCFQGCKSLRRVTFGSSSSLERIGVEAFGSRQDGSGLLAPCGLVEIHIPDSVRQLCGCCFQGCRSLRRVTFGSLSSLERIDASCFEGTGVEEVSIPDGVHKLCDRCFRGCKSLHRVTFGPSSSLERIGASCFEGTGVEEVCIPDGVRKLRDGCFTVIFGNGC